MKMSKESAYLQELNDLDLIDREEDFITKVCLRKIWVLITVSCLFSCSSLCAGRDECDRKQDLTFTLVLVVMGKTDQKGAQESSPPN